MDDDLLILSDEDDDKSEDGDAECLFCGNMFKKDEHGEEWFQMGSRNVWSYRV